MGLRPGQQKLEQQEDPALCGGVRRPEANDTGAGGVFTSGILESVETLVENAAKSGTDVHPMAGEVYNETVRRFGELYQSGAQEDNQTFQYAISAGANFDEFVWPFWPGANSGWEIDTPLE